MRTQCYVCHERQETKVYVYFGDDKEELVCTPCLISMIRMPVLQDLKNKAVLEHAREMKQTQDECRRIEAEEKEYYEEKGLRLEYCINQCHPDFYKFKFSEIVYFLDDGNWQSSSFVGKNNEGDFIVNRASDLQTICKEVVQRYFWCKDCGRRLEAKPEILVIINGRTRCKRCYDGLSVALGSKECYGRL